MSTSLDQKFTADASQIEAVFEKMKRHNQDLLTQLQKLKTEQKQGHQEAEAAESKISGWLQSNIADLSKMALGYFTVQGAISFVSKTFDHYLERQRKSIEQQKELNDLILEAAGTSGNMLEADKYKEFAGSASRAGLSNEKTAAGVLAEISKATQFSSMPQREALAIGVLGAAPLMSDEHLKKTAMMAGELTDIFGPKYRDRQGDVADVAVAARQLGGADWEKIASPYALKSLTSVTASGAMSPEEGLAMMISGFASNQNSRLMESLDDALNRHIPIIAQPKTREDLLNNKLAKMNPVQRLAQIDADKDKGDKGAGAFLLGGNAVNYYAAKNDLAPIQAEINRALAPGDYIAEQKQKVAGSAVFQQRAAEVRAGALASAALSEHEIRSQALKSAVEFVNSNVDRNDPLGPDWVYKINEAQLGYQTFNLAPQDIAEKALTKSFGTGLSTEQQNAFIKEQRELITKQLEAAKSMKEAAEELKRTKAAPANPIDVRARGESR